MVKQAKVFNTASIFNGMGITLKDQTVQVKLYALRRG